MFAARSSSSIDIPDRPREVHGRLYAADNQFSAEERFSWLRRFGSHSQHFTGLQPGMQYFDVPGTGYLAFAPKWGASVVLGDPVAATSDHAEVIERFLSVHPWATFVQMTPPVAQLLHNDHGFYSTQIGIEQKVPVADWTMSGKNRKAIRKAVNQAHAQGITVSEDNQSVNVDAISDRWLDTRRARSREIRFLVRPRQMPHIAGTRYFYAWKDKQPIGFACFDPTWHADRITGYLPNVSRMCPTFRQGLFYAMMAHALDVFRSEQIAWLNLGLHPMVLNDPIQTYESRTTRRIFDLVYRYGRHYNFQGVHFTKQRFGGEWEPTYFCHRRALPAADLTRLTGLIGLF